MRQANGRRVTSTLAFEVVKQNNLDSIFIQLVLRLNRLNQFVVFKAVSNRPYSQFFNN